MDVRAEGTVVRLTGNPPTKEVVETLLSIARLVHVSRVKRVELAARAAAAFAAVAPPPLPSHPGVKEWGVTEECNRVSKSCTGTCHLIRATTGGHASA